MKPAQLMSILASCVVVTAVQSAPAETQEDSDSPKIRSRIPRAPVESSAISAIGYSKRLQILEIEFLNGAIYRYTGVPRSVYHKLMAAESKARYYDENIKGSYKSARVRRWQTKPEH